MKFYSAPNLALCLFSAGLAATTPVALAQHEAGQVQGPSKYESVSNAEIKFGMSNAYIQNESAEVQALREANAPVHNLGLMNITGTPRALYFTGFDAFADLEKHHDQVVSNTKLEDALKAGSANEAAMLTGHMYSIYRYREDLSLNAAVDLAQMRFFDIAVYHVRSGHHQDFERLVKFYIKAFSSVPGARWAVFEKMYGVGSDNTFIVTTPMKDLAAVDQEFMNDENLPKTVGADQLQMMRELGSATIESYESDLFVVVPQITYAPDSWLKADPDFWGKK